MEKNIFFVISGPKSNYPENLDLIDKKNGHTDIQTYRHPIALYNGIISDSFLDKTPQRVLHFSTFYVLGGLNCPVARFNRYMFKNILTFLNMFQ